MGTEKTIGWIGTGVMGLSMCARLMDAGYHAIVYSRTQAKAGPLLAAGADWVDSVAEVAKVAPIVFTMVGFPDDVASVYLGEEGLVEAASQGSLLIDMTTTKPSLAVRIAQAARSRGIGFIDAPVSGGDVGARNGTLSIMVGGIESDFERAEPFFNIMGGNIVHQGENGAGQHTKMCNQIVIAGTMAGVCESLVYARKAGLDPQTVLASIGKGAAGCWTLDHLAPRIFKRDFAPGFYIDHFIKDMAIALEESARMGISVPGLALVHQLYCAVKAQGHGKSGTQALILALEQMSALDSDT